MAKIISSILLIFFAAAWQCAYADEMVFVLIGQSNMVGFGQVRELRSGDAEFPPNVVFYEDGERKRLGQQRRFGPEVGFARMMAEAFPRDTIVLAKHAVGGTSIGRWMPDASDQGDRLGSGPMRRGAPIYPALMVSLKTVIRSDRPVCSILMMQGEADAKSDALAGAYGTRIADFVAALRRDLKSPQALFIYGKVNPPPDRFPAVELVRQHQQTLARSLPSAVMIDTDDLSKRPDGLHYDSMGQLELGRRFAAAYISNAKKSGCAGIKSNSSELDPRGNQK